MVKNEPTLLSKLYRCLYENFKLIYSQSTDFRSNYTYVHSYLHEEQKNIVNILKNE